MDGNYNVTKQIVENSVVTTTDNRITYNKSGHFIEISDVHTGDEGYYVGQQWGPYQETIRCCLIHLKTYGMCEL